MKINDYVRTKKGIARITGKNDDVRMWYPNAFVTDTFLEINDDTEYIYKEDIIKSSPNIIDLIEVGDIIRLKNFAGVYRVCDVSNGKIELDYQGELGAIIINNSSDIKSIVTKEQFSSMEYKLGDK